MTIKVAHIDTELTWRGGEAQVIGLCQGLKEQGIEFLLIANPGSAIQKRANELGFPTLPLKMRGEWDLPAAGKLRKILTREKPNLCHCHTAHAHTLAWLATMAQRNLPLVISRRVDFPISRNPLSRLKYLSSRTHYLAISQGVKQVLRNGGVPEERIHIVHSGIDPKRFSTPANPDKLRQEFDLPADTLIIGNIAHLADHKGHKYLIQAADIVTKYRKNLKFFIVGEGQERPDLEELIREKRLQDYVVLTGFRTDIADFLALFDIFVLSSYLEGLCTSLLDAMYMKLPVVATRTGGVPDIVQDGVNGLLVPPRDPKALAQAILTLLSDKALQNQLAQAGYQRVSENFTIEKTINQTIETYQHILNITA